MKFLTVQLLLLKKWTGWIN